MGIRTSPMAIGRVYGGAGPLPVILIRVRKRLPFPDPRLTLGEVRRLARGRTSTHRALQRQVDRLLS